MFFLIETSSSFRSHQKLYFVDIFFFVLRHILRYTLAFYLDLAFYLTNGVRQLVLILEFLHAIHTTFLGKIEQRSCSHYDNTFRYESTLLNVRLPPIPFSVRHPGDVRKQIVDAHYFDHYNILRHAYDTHPRPYPERSTLLRQDTNP